LPARRRARNLEAVKALERLGLQAARGELVVPGAARARALASRMPVLRSGTALEVAELSWIAEGVTRELALSIPSVLACRNLIAGTVLQLPLFRYRGGDRLDPGYLLTKPDPSTTIVSTIGGTVDDLLFRGRAYWRALERDSEGFVTRARWTPVDDVTPEVRSSGGAYSMLTGYTIAGVDGVLPPEDVIRFDSGLPGVLDVGGRTLASAIELEQAARRFAAVELPAGVITNEGAELSSDELGEAAAKFAAQRRELGIAALQGWKYERADISPGDLQLIEARANVATDVCRLFGVPVSMIGASPSGNAAALLYSNLSQQLAILVSTAVAPHLQTIEAALSDVVPRGQSVAFDVQTFLRSDPQAAADYAIALEGAGLIDRAEARALLGIPSSTASDLTPGRV
jgi:HK97 family phage portal protein